MFEIEAKVPLSKRGFQRLKNDIQKIAEKKGNVINKDYYYYSSPKSFFLRIRDKNGNGLINLKSKVREKGIEMNQEIEIPITSLPKLDRFFKKIGINLSAKKEKVSEIYKKGDFQIELNHIKTLGYFLEIETIVKSESQIPKAKKSLLALFSKLGFKPSDFEKKYYLELLNEKASQ